jgi:hypothetical protein
LAGALDLFPPDVIGASKKAKYKVYVCGDDVFATDIDGSKKIFRTRKWRQFTEKY